MGAMTPEKDERTRVADVLEAVHAGTRSVDDALERLSALRSQLNAGDLVTSAVADGKLSRAEVREINTLANRIGEDLVMVKQYLLGVRREITGSSGVVGPCTDAQWRQLLSAFVHLHDVHGVAYAVIAAMLGTDAATLSQWRLGFATPPASAYRTAIQISVRLFEATKTA